MLRPEALEKIADRLLKEGLDGDNDAVRTYVLLAPLLREPPAERAAFGPTSNLPLPSTGSDLRHPGHTPPDLVNRILAMREDGMSYPGIAKQLNAEGVKTSGGGREWYPPVVRSIVLRHGGRAS